jgi:hypothetical protein
LAGRFSGASRRVVAVLAVGLCVAACSSEGSSSGTQAESTLASGSPADSPAAAPRVDLISPAITALEDRLGGPQQYFEINATSQLVNMIVALNDGALAQPWVYLDGELSSTEGVAASGFTFSAATLDFDPDAVLTKLQAELPQSSADLFFVEGGAGGIVRYSVAVTSQQGGQLVVAVGPDGTVQSVDPN